MGHAFVSDLRRWDIVSGLCQSIDARTYVEIGCKAGETTGRVLAECPQLSAIAIDPWCEQPKPGSFVTRLLPIGQSGMGATVEEVSKIPEDPTRETSAGESTSSPVNSRASTRSRPYARRVASMLCWMNGDSRVCWLGVTTKRCSSVL